VSDVNAVPEIDELIAQSLRIGADPRLVQGAGGNLSLKHDGVMWIKASGTRLGEAAERPIFVPMGIETTRAAVLETEDLVPYVLIELAAPGLRPSIETALHVLLPHRVVFHAHATGAIAAGLTAQSAARIRDLPGADVAVVPYAKPGIELARAVFAELGDDVDPERPLVLLLRNHGVVVGAADGEAAGALLDSVERFLRTETAPEAAATAPAPGAPVPAGDPVLLHPAGTVGPRAAEVLTGGAFTPDAAVFLGPQPFGREGAWDESPCVVGADGSVRARGGLGADEVEIAISLVDVARQVGGDEPTSSLTERDVHALLNWEAEKWRQNLKR
jgi:ribulose-5-phosphate 4-epimerase/fuculose-1-phosphate aldolase